MSSGTTIAKAYVSIIPSMEGAQSTITKSLNLESIGTSSGKTLGNSLASGLSSVASTIVSAGTAAVSAMSTATTTVITAAITGIATLTTAAVKSYAEYEQQSGAIEKIYGNSSNKIAEYASTAWQTAGMSVNDYYETATSISGALITNLEGDTDLAAVYADRAISQIADIANTYGYSIEETSEKYKSVALGNYTTIDTLTAGSFAGTKAGFEDLIDTTADMIDIQEELGITVESGTYTYDNFVNAMEVWNTSMGIAGTTTKEALGTISGSVNSTKASWENFKTAIGSGDVDMLNDSLDGLKTSILGVEGESNGLINNVIPVVENVLNSITTSVDDLITPMVNSLLPTLITAAQNIILSLSTALDTNLSTLIELAINTTKSTMEGGESSILSTAVDIWISVFDTLSSYLDEILIVCSEQIVNIATTISSKSGDFLSAVATLFTSIISALPTMASNIISALPTIVQNIIDSAVSFVENDLPDIIDAILELLDYLPDIIDTLVSALPEIITSIVEALPDLIPALVEGAISLAVGICESAGEIALVLIEALPEIIQAIADAIPTLIDTLVDSFLTLGAELVIALVDGWTETLDNGSAIGESLNDITLSVLEIVANLGLAVRELISTALTNIGNAIVNWCSPLIDTLLNLWDNITEGVEIAWNSIKDFISTTLTNISDTITTIWNAISTFFITIFTTISNTVSTVWNAIKNTISIVINAIKTNISTIWNSISLYISNIINTIKTNLSNTWNTIKNTISTVINAIKTNISNIWNNISTTISNVINNIKNNISSTWNSISSTVSSVINSIKSTISSVWSSIQSTASSMWSSIKTSITSPIESAKTTISNTVSSISSSVTSVFSSLYTSVSNTWDSIKSAITSPIDTAKSTLSNTISSIKSLFDFSLKIDLKVPHVSVTGGVAPYGIGGQGSLPKFSVSWYSKGYDEAQILQSAAIFGITTNGQLLGGGEHGNEVVVGEEHLLDMIAQTQRENTMGTQNIVINVYGADGQSEEQIAEKVIDKLTEMTNNRRVVYA